MSTIALRPFYGISVCQEGADPTGQIDSTVEINRARRLALRHNAALVFEGGTFLHAGNIGNIGGPERWVGQSFRRTVLKVDRVGAAFRPSLYTTVESMRFLGDNRTGSIGILPDQRASQYVFRDVQVEKFQIGVRLLNTYAGTFDNLRVLDCSATGIDPRTLAVKHTFTGGYVARNGIGVNLSGGSGIDFMGVTVEENINFGYRAASQGSILRASIRNSQIERNGAAEIYLAAPNAQMITIEENTFVGLNDVIRCDAGKDTRIDKNLIHGSVNGGKAITVGSLAIDTRIGTNPTNNQGAGAIPFNPAVHDNGTNTVVIL